ncbi:C6 zinc finger domain-containing protein [Colletotrichum karsti]|uniref:C6 zinc finger domain-containing protein n=1 Tax=Colletotrichum karsti TaxID=1095194 RepID=A0A9P6LKG7_9PEZI|nr:C6 zinc finger domain-containing protein [Colletotrichum karsti]KAF9876136.1 C6 zinc finger domain-containing protein [Colletotrichum karsti]
MHAAQRTIVARGTWRLQDILVEPGYDCAFFTDPEERGYFDFWRILVNNIYLFPSDVMARLLPQLARHEPAIKHAALAMAAMARALVPNLKRRTRKELQSNGPHYEFALKHYVRAIKLVRTSVPSSENMLWAIVCCVLFVTFECLHGDRYAALSHVNHAYKMMEDYFSRRSLVGANPETESVRSVCDDAAWIFQGMTMQSWSHNKLHPREENEINWCCRGSKHPFAVDEMPMTFDSLHSGRRWWRVVQHYICHRCPIYKDMYADESATAQEVRFGSCSRSTYDSKEAEHLRMVLPEFLGHLQRWSNGFQGVYNKLRKGRKWDFHSYVEACNLRVQYLLLWTDVISTSYSEVEAVTALTPEFREIVYLSRDILETQSNCGGCSDVFSMDNGPTMPLLVVACNCRDPDVRQEATELLGKHPRRDGLWDSRTFHTIAMKNMEIEAENVTVGNDQGDEWSRLVRREVYFDAAGNIQAKLVKWQPHLAEWRVVDEQLEQSSRHVSRDFAKLSQQQQQQQPIDLTPG